MANSGKKRTKMSPNREFFTKVTGKTGNFLQPGKNALNEPKPGIFYNREKGTKKEPKPGIFDPIELRVLDEIIDNNFWTKS